MVASVVAGDTTAKLKLTTWTNVCPCCEEAERLEGVDSERWDVVREMGSSSRWSAHPVVVDQETREVIPEGDATWMVFMK